MIKRLCTLIFLSIVLQLGTFCAAQTQYSATITKMEKSLFGVDYSNQSDEARIKRIEETVYGSASSSTLQQRMDKLSKDLSADLIGQEIKPKTDTFADEQEAYKEPIPKADSSVNYPIVDNLEQKVFQKTFKTTEINQRLANLEKNVFKKTFSDDLSTRTERLKTALLPQSSGYEDYEDNDSEYLSENSTGYATPPDPSQGTSIIDEILNHKNNSLNKTPVYNSKNSVLDDYQYNSDLAIPLASLEKQILKKSFPDDTVSNRLMRLELKVFNTNFTDDDESTRLDRIASAHQAKKSSKRYDNNKFSQHASTAMQIGAFLLVILAAIL